MNMNPRFLILFSLVFCLSVKAEQFRQFTLAKPTTFQATLLEKDAKAQTVRLRMADGTEHTVPGGKFSKEDIKYISDWSAETGEVEIREWALNDRKVVQAKVVGKNENDKTVSLRLPDGTVKVVDVDLFIDEDQKYIQLWLPNEEQLSCIVAGKPRDGLKLVRVLAFAGPHDARLVFYTPPTEKTEFPEPDVKSPWTYRIKAGDKFDHNITMENNYRVSLFWDNAIIDSEAYNQKTGKRH